MWRGRPRPRSHCGKLYRTIGFLTLQPAQYSANWITAEHAKVRFFTATSGQTSPSIPVLSPQHLDVSISMEEIKQVGICFQGLYGVPVIQTQCFSPNVESPPEKWRCFLIMSHCEVQGSEIVEVGPQIGTVGRQTFSSLRIARRKVNSAAAKSSMYS